MVGESRFGSIESFENLLTIGFYWQVRFHWSLYHRWLAPDSRRGQGHSLSLELGSWHRPVYSDSITSTCVTRRRSEYGPSCEPGQFQADKPFLALAWTGNWQTASDLVVNQNLRPPYIPARP